MLKVAFNFVYYLVAVTFLVNHKVLDSVIDKIR